MSTTSLVTHGYICYSGEPIPVPAPISLDTPSITGVVEVHPRIRRTEFSGETSEKPLIVSSQELKPQTIGRITPDPSPATPPKTRTAQELKPKIIKAEEED